MFLEIPWLFSGHQSQNQPQVSSEKKTYSTNKKLAKTNSRQKNRNFMGATSECFI